MIRFEKCIITLLMLMVVLCFGGCQNKTDAIKEDLGQDKASGEAAESKGEIRQEYNIPENVEYSVLDSKGKSGYQVKATVDVASGNKPSVYKQEAVEFTAAAVKERAEILFDEGEYSFVKPYSAFSYEEMEELAQSLNNEIKGMEEKGIETYSAEYTCRYVKSNAVKEDMGEFQESEVKNYEEGEYCKGNVNTFYDSIMIIKGKIKGEEYYLLAYEAKEKYFMQLCKEERGYDETVNGTFTNGMDLGVESTIDDEQNMITISRGSVGEVVETDNIEKSGGPNQCKYSREEAEELALNFAGYMGDSDMTVSSVSWCQDVNAMSACQGYIFYLQRSFKGIPCVGSEEYYWWNWVNKQNESGKGELDPDGLVVSQEFYRVQVMDEGVVAIDLWSPQYKATEELTASADLMDFDEIVELSKDYLEPIVEAGKGEGSTAKNVATVTGIELRYVTVCYDGKYALIPAWVFNARSETALIINAMDGTKVFAAPEIVGAN